MSIRKLAGQTAIYGVSSVIGRMLYAFLVPLYTNLPDLISKAEYGIVSDVYAMIAILMVVYTYRMEMAYFRFGAEKGQEPKAFNQALSSHVITTLIFTLVAVFLGSHLADWLDYGKYTPLIYLGGIILALDTLSEVPKARLRLQDRPFRFASVQLSGIGVNLGLNVFFLVVCPWILSLSHLAHWHPYIRSIFNPDLAIMYIFLSNIAGSLVSLLMLLPAWKGFQFSIHGQYWMRMMGYAAPLIIVGFSFVINETLDRKLIPLLASGSKEERFAMLGVYSANYKLAMFIALFTQAFRYGAEPFFFKQRHAHNAHEIYAKIARYFTLAAVFGMLTVTLMLPLARYVRYIGPDYWEGMQVVPILLFANVMLGVYYNFSLWYKLMDQTKWGAVISTGGAVITIVLNIWWIPIYGYIGSAWATLICYSGMCVATYLLGQRFLPIPYAIGRMMEYLLSALLVMGFAELLPDASDLSKIGIHLLLLSSWMVYIWIREGKPRISFS